MTQTPTKFVHFVPYRALILVQAALIVGCGGSSTGPAAGLAPPKNRMEGLQRINQANIEHDKGAPPGQRSSLAGSKRR